MTNWKQINVVANKQQTSAYNYWFWFEGLKSKLLIEQLSPENQKPKYIFSVTKDTRCKQYDAHWELKNNLSINFHNND